MMSWFLNSLLIAGTLAFCYWWAYEWFHPKRMQWFYERNAKEIESYKSTKRWEDIQRRYFQHYYNLSP